MKRPALVLASQSPIRAQMLRAAGLAPEIVPAHLDERAAEATLARDDASQAMIARHLACAKALAVSRRMPDDLVLGADQTLSLEGQRLSKARNRGEAAEHLRLLAGRTHELAAGIALAERGHVVWSTVAIARVTLRALSATALEAYLDAMGDRVLATVGAYEIEGLGAQLIERVEGDVFTIQGLPLLPLLAELRRRDLLTV